MIFEPEKLCTCLKCEEYNVISPVNSLNAVFGVMLVSSGEVIADGVIGALCAGSLLLYNGSIKISPGVKSHIILCELGGSAVQAAARGMEQRIVSDCASCQMVPEILSCLLESDISKSRVVSLSFELLCALASANEKKESMPALISDAISEMHKNYAEIYGIEELSAQLGVSKSHLVRVFSHHMGMPPGQYLTRVRIDAAKLLLSSRDYPLDAIATLCGFSGANYLCKVFKKETGKTPAEYRRATAGIAENQAALSDIEGSFFL